MATPPQPPPLIAHLPHTLTLLIIGDLILDEYLHGTISRTAADFPVPVLLAGRTHHTPGGAANLAQNCRSLGPSVAVHLLGVVGADEAGSALLRLLRATGVDVGGVQMVRGRPTTHKMRVVAQMDHRLVRVDRECKAAISAAAEAGILAAVREKIPEVHGIIFSDYNNGVLTPSLLEGVVREAAARGLPMVLDPKGKDWKRYEGVTVIKPNLNELHTLTNLPVDSEDAVHAAAMMLFRQVQCESLIVTRAEDGVDLYTREGFQKNIPALPVDGNIDVNGAGDTFTAAFALSYFNGANLEDAAKIGNAAAGVVVSKTGTATASREEVSEKLSRTDLSFEESAHRTDGKILSREDLLARLKIERQRGAKIVFVHDSFDTIDGYSVECFELARSSGTLLVVGISADESASALEHSRSDNSTTSTRARVLAGLACVDFVTVFPGSSPEALLLDMRTEVYQLPES